MKSCIRGRSRLAVEWGILYYVRADGSGIGYESPAAAFRAPVPQYVWGCTTDLVYHPEGGRGYDGGQNYKASRSNGLESDSPTTPFPNDGIYTWDTPDKNSSYICYTEGSGDKAWMEKRDLNYILRLAREGRLLELESNADKEIAADHHFRDEIPRALKEARERAEEAKSHFERGVGKQTAGDYAVAIETYGKVIELDARFAPVYRHQAEIRNDLGEYSAAMEDIGKAIELDSKYALAYVIRGNIQYNLGNTLAAIEDYNQALILFPSDSYAYGSRGEAIRNAEDCRKAMEYFVQGVSKNPRSFSLYANLGVAKLGLGDYRGAVEDFSRALELNPKMCWVYHRRGKAKYLSGDYKGALSDCDQALSLTQIFPLCCHDRGEILVKLGESTEVSEEKTRLLSQAAEAYRTCVKLNPTQSAWQKELESVEGKERERKAKEAEDLRQAEELRKEAKQKRQQEEIERKQQEEIRQKEEQEAQKKAEEKFWQEKVLQLETQIKGTDSQLEILHQHNVELTAQLSSEDVLRLPIAAQEQLKAKLTQDLLITNQQIYIKSKPVLSKYYDTFRLCMTRFCHGAFSIASGFVAREEGFCETIGKGIITYILPGIGKIITFSAAAYLRRQNLTRLREFSQFAKSYGEAHECIDETARVLTLAQEDDLIAISEAKPSLSVRAKVGRFFQATKDWVLSEDCPEGLERKAKEDALELMGRFIDAIEEKRKISHLATLLLDEKIVEETLRKRCPEPTPLLAPSSESEVAIPVATLKLEDEKTTTEPSKEKEIPAIPSSAIAVIPVSTPVDAAEVAELKERVDKQNQVIERMTKQLQEALRMGKDVKTMKELMTSLGFSTSGDGPLVQLSSSDFAHDDLTLVQRLLRMITARDDFISALASELAQLKERVELRL